MNYTPKQLEILHIIKRSTKERGYSPTYAEIASVMDTSPVTVFEHITALEKKGAIRRRKYEARSLEISDPDWDKRHITDTDREVKPFVDLLVKIRSHLMADDEFADVAFDPEIMAGINTLLLEHKHLLETSDESGS
jgi:SOS-response transcriptional repressor LexA